MPHSSSIIRPYQANRDDILFTPDMSSEQLSLSLGLPILFFHLDELPHAPGHLEAMRDFSTPELADRAEWIWQRLHQLPAPLRQTIDYDTISTAAAALGPCVVGNHEKQARASPHAGPLPLRLEGDGVRLQSILLACDRTWDCGQYWRLLTKLGAHQIDPKAAADNDVKRYIFLHEIGHILQRQHEKETQLGLWRRERDADAFAFEQMQRQGISADTIKATKMARALHGFLNPANIYKIALDIDAEDRGAKRVGYRECTRGMRGLHLAVYNRLIGNRTFDVNGSVLDLRHMKEAENYFSEIGWNAGIMIPALRDVLKDFPAGTNPYVRRSGELIMDAARHFCPALAAKPAPSSVMARIADWMRPWRLTDGGSHFQP